MHFDNQKLLSICCLGYNHGAFLAENLQSICRIGYAHIEIIVVDDGSSDDSVEKLHLLKQEIPYPLEIIAQKNTGNIGKNFNAAWRKAKGELITFIALDDVFHPATIRSEIELMNNNSSLAFVASSKTVSIDNQGFLNSSNPQELALARLSHPSVSDCLELEYKKFGSFYIQGSIFRKEIVDQIGGFDEDMTGDDIVLRTKIFNYMLNHSEWTFEITRKNSVFYRLHENNVHKNAPRQIKIVTEYLERFWPNHPNPPILTSWLSHLIRNFPAEQYMEVFGYNQRAADLLKDKHVQKMIEKSERKKNSFTERFIFSRKRFDNGDRQIFIFGILVFSYSKNNRKNSGRKRTHYLDCA
jgi:glycosyltransferase involved in cell wall biosynthesis